MIVPEGDFAIEQRVPAQSPTRARRAAPAATNLPGISREVEFAYIRSDMRRLLVIAGALFALMLVLLLLVNR